VSLVRVHNFSISLDGFGTGEPQSHDAPFGHAGERLHEWMITTRWWREMVGERGGTRGLDDAFARPQADGAGVRDVDLPKLNTRPEAAQLGVRRRHRTLIRHRAEAPAISSGSLQPPSVPGVDVQVSELSPV
jgi:hypothetical protein